MSESTWHCHVCGRQRPDRAIGVFKRQGPHPGVSQNVRYCLDSAECAAGAPTVTFFEPGESERAPAAPVYQD